MSEMEESIESEESVGRKEVLRRRSRRLKKLAEVYSDHYWALIEELKNKHKQFYWTTAQSPFHPTHHFYNHNNDLINNNNNDIIINDENDYDDDDDGSNSNRCRTNGCKNKAMALTSFCITHILSDPNQLLYKPCTYSIKSSASGPIICMKPIVRSVVPSLCPQHLEKSEKTLRMALKKSGYSNATTATKIAPKINALVAESVRQIQSKRRAAKKVKNTLLVDTTEG